MPSTINATLENLLIFIMQIYIVTWTIKACCSRKKPKPTPKKIENVKCVKRIKLAKPTPNSSGSSTTTSIPLKFQVMPLAPTPPDEETARDVSFQILFLTDSKEKGSNELESRKLLPYPEVKPPTLSQKRRREKELEREKKEKIASGFYQSRSDEDDTLEKVTSLKEELTERSRKRSMKQRKMKVEMKGEEKKSQLPPLPPPPL
ncbi:hypothetical protein RB195_011520 [Necator americanus]|uniref:Uncharacterized protein n=1 Tax=Necator americanus TaxID=51031 RepID=A0ABR1D3Q7_NECAM